MLPFTRMPCLEAPPMPPKKLRGMEITKAQGQDTTRKFSALGTHTPQPPSSSKEGITARARAAKTTAGV